MSILLLLIPLSLLFAGSFLLAFVWAVRSGQYEDTVTPAMRVLLEDARRAEAVRGVEVEKREKAS